MKIVVLSPHRDDAAFSLGLAIESWLDAGHAVHVVNCFTRSDYAPFAEDELLHSDHRPERITDLRLQEDLRWRQQYGAGLSSTDLGLEDAPLRLHCPPEAVCSCEVMAADTALDTIREALIPERSSALVLPLSLGGHVDHKTTREAAIPTDEPTMAHAFYEDLPYAARPGIAKTIERTANAVEAELAPIFVTEETDAKAAVLRKRRAALCYSSQVDEQGVDQIAQFCKRYGGRERLWANAAWRASNLRSEGSPSQAAGR